MTQQKHYETEGDKLTEQGRHSEAERAYRAAQNCCNLLQGFAEWLQLQEKLIFSLKAQGAL